MQSKLRQMQVKSLTSSLNPHFINNSLHWLQYKVKGDKEAVLLIGRLSDNIRTVFQHSRDGRPYQTLKEELHLVENYLLIQKVRVEDSLSFKLPNINGNVALASINIPLMEIQIHVKNAVEHGIRNRKNANYVKAQITEDDTYVHIETEDEKGR